MTTPKSGGRSGQTLAFAVPIDTAGEILSRAAHAGAARVADIGLGGGADHAASNGSSNGPNAGASAGARVPSVVRGGPAAMAGVTRGDVIERVDGNPVASISDVLALVTTRSPGQSVILTLRRGHRLRTVTVVLGSRTAPASSEAG